MKKIGNYKINRSKWQDLNFEEQMGSITSEVGRAFKAQESGYEERAVAALTRTIDLFDATTEGLVSQKGSRRLREVLRAKEEFITAYMNNNPEDKASIENYFTQFAVAARKGH